MDCPASINRIVPALNAQGLFPGDGYGKAKSTQLRFANFAAHSKEQYELLVDTLSGIE
jgi:phosphoserine aminotransferase